MTKDDDFVESKIEQLFELAEEPDSDEYVSNIDDALSGDEWDYQQYYTVIYEYRGISGVLSSLLKDLRDLDHDVKVMANKGDVQKRVEVLEENQDFIRSIREGLVSLAVEEVPALTGEQDSNVDEYQALLSPRERKAIRGERDLSPSEVNHVDSRVRRRIRSRFAKDVDLLREKRPELFDELKEELLDEMSRGWGVEDFSLGDEVRLKDGSVYVVEDIRVGAGDRGDRVELGVSEGTGYTDKVIVASEVVEILG